MCVLAFAWRPNSRWRLVVAGNRDELHARPAQTLARWDSPPHLLAGRDLLSGGTWMGVSEESRFAVVTNVHGYGMPDPDLQSRGALVVRLLSGQVPVVDAELVARFNAVNVISVEGDQASFFANRPASQHRSLEPGIYGLSNADLDAPWPKTLRLRSGVEQWLADARTDTAELLDLLAEGRATPVDPLVKPERSPLFIRNPVYGTRCSTVVLVDWDGQGTIVERSYSADAAITGQTELSFNWRS
jgi:uncharacterized protein with NRDE domain